MEAINRKEIETLLQRYFEAETDVHEERRLKTYFNSGEIDPSFEVYRDFFVLTHHDQSIEISDAFERRLMDKISPAPVIRIGIRRVLAIAASLALIVAAGWWVISQRNSDEATQVVMEDTYDDPEEAYRQVTAALALMSSTMDKGQQMTIQSVAPAQELDVIQMN
ncbi:MAG: hypothetical protein K9I85_08040 [Saprospiraceae bacterium]|nr:hypothetical protein [Saprospiraceae bacterium]